MRVLLNGGWYDTDKQAYIDPAEGAKTAHSTTECDRVGKYAKPVNQAEKSVENEPAEEPVEKPKKATKKTKK